VYSIYSDISSVENARFSFVNGSYVTAYSCRVARNNTNTPEGSKFKSYWHHNMFSLYLRNIALY
jgi:hypothetical protein